MLVLISKYKMRRRTQPARSLETSCVICGSGDTTDAGIRKPRFLFSAVLFLRALRLFGVSWIMSCWERTEALSFAELCAPVLEPHLEKSMTTLTFAFLIRTAWHFRICSAMKSLRREMKREERAMKAESFSLKVTPAVIQLTGLGIIIIIQQLDY